MDNAVSIEAAARINEDEKAAVEAGFAPQAPLFAVGTLINEVGRGNWQRSRQAWENLPTVDNAMSALALRVAGESRSDHECSASEVRMDESGDARGMLRLGDAVYGVEREGFGQLCRRVNPLQGAVSYLQECDPALRAINVNSHLAGREGIKLNLRTRRAVNGTRQVFAVTSPKYKAYDIDHVAVSVAEALSQDGGRAEVVYDGRRARIDVLWHSDVAPENAAAGEFFKAGVRITTADDATQGHKVQALIERNLCLNLIVIDRAAQLVVNKRHTGAADMQQVYREGIASAKAKVDYFIKRWASVKNDELLKRVHAVSLSVEKTFEGLVASGLLGQAPKSAVEPLVAAYNKEPGDDTQALVNAVTRAAHEGLWNTPTFEEQLQNAAGDMLFMDTATLSTRLIGGVLKVTRAGE